MIKRKSLFSSLLFLVACNTPVEPRGEDSIASAVLASPGTVTILPAPTQCMSGPVPIWTPVSTVPTENAWLGLPWTIEGSGYLITLMFSIKNLENPVDLTALGLPGCWLLVRHDYLIPANTAFTPSWPAIWYDGSQGRGEVWWICAPELTIFDFYLQLVVLDSFGNLRGSDAIIVKFSKL